MTVYETMQLYMVAMAFGTIAGASIGFITYWKK